MNTCVPVVALLSAALCVLCVHAHAHAVSYTYVASSAASSSLSSPSLPSLQACSLAPAPYADWAHRHWVWLHNSIANQSNEIDLVNGYLSRGIPVGAVDCDSQWATGDNNFVFNTAKYPNASAMVEYFHSINVRVVLWATSMVDSDSPNFAEAKAKGYLLNDGELIKWWHGHGGLLDYSYAEAVEWWHAQMDNVLDIGVDGFKCDGTDPYIYLLVIARGHAGNIVTYREYADAYYGDFFDYTRKKRGPVGLIMSRPVDDFWSFSPQRVVFSGWVGDQDPTFDGLQSALTNMMHSAWRKYVGFGSDIGGYRSGGPAPFGRTKELYFRWFQVGAFTPLMENGGGGEHRPWMYDEELGTNDTVETYRRYAVAHTELVPYLLSAGTEAYAKNESIIHPLATDLGPVPVKDFRFLLGSSIFVAPVTAEGVTSLSVEFPKGSNWVSYWDHSVTYKGGEKASVPLTLADIPVFQRAGSIVPLLVDSPHSHHGHAEALRGQLTLMIAQPFGSAQTAVYDSPEAYHGGRMVSYTCTDGERGCSELVVSVTAHPQPASLLLKGVPCPAMARELVTAGGASSPLPLHDSLDALVASGGFGVVCRDGVGVYVVSKPSTHGYRYHVVF